MNAEFFIRRPIFSAVLSITIALAGLVSLLRLPVEQYPDIAPPTVQVSAVYPGASAETVADSVAAPIEEQVNGVEGMLYMSSTSSNDGSYSLTLSFEVGTDLDLAAVRVQNRVAIAEPRLPEDVRRQGVVTRKQSTSTTAVLNFSSPDAGLGTQFITNYLNFRVVDELRRLEGVGDARVVGGRDYSMRIWFDPAQLERRQLSVADLVAALREQNVQVAAGVVGQPPAPPGQAQQLTVQAQGRLSDPEQFEAIVVAERLDGTLVRVRDVARVELGALDYSAYSELNGNASVSMLIYQLPGSNSLEVKRRVVERMAELAEDFPAGLEYSVAYDTTLFVEQSIREVLNTLLIAMALVFGVVWLFLGDLRATLIPALAIPVALVGTASFMGALGFSINLLTLFGLVLAIGIVVDDVIVVVENVRRLIDEEGLEPLEAAIRAMRQVSGPIVATTLVLMAVFVPGTFQEGITGRLYRQFALTIAVSTSISSITALTLAPALSAIVLRAGDGASSKALPFRLFDRAFDRFRELYVATSGFFMRHLAAAALLWAAVLGATAWRAEALPGGFLPTEDQGVVIVFGQLPDGASLQRTGEVGRRVARLTGDLESVERTVMIAGFSLFDGTNVPNAFTMYCPLLPWSERGADGSLEAVLQELNGRFAGIPEARVLAFAPPAIRGLGNSGGFDYRLLDFGDSGPAALQRQADLLIAEANALPELQRVSTTFSASVPQLFADVDREKAKALQVELGDVFLTLQAALGSLYVNDFQVFGRPFQVRLQADAPFRDEREDIGRLEVRSRSGEMVPLASLMRVEDRIGPELVTRFNLYPSAGLRGQTAPTVSSGEALQALAGLSDEVLGSGFGYAWSGISFEEQRAGGSALTLYGLSVLFVFLVLAAQYESWAMPFAIVLAVPLGLLGAVLGLGLRGLPFDVYAQIGLVLLLALAAKNAILVVEVARERRRAGAEILEAAREAAATRLRPILMTSFSFVLGVLPLVVASGAGAASRRAIGTTVFAGMLLAVLLTAVLVPAFFVALQRFSEWLLELRGKSFLELHGTAASSREGEDGARA